MNHLFETYDGDAALKKRGPIMPGDEQARQRVSRLDSCADLETVTMDKFTIYWQAGGRIWSTANPACFKWLRP